VVGLGQDWARGPGLNALNAALRQIAAIPFTFFERLLGFRSPESVSSSKLWSEPQRHVSFPKIISARSDDAIRTRLVWR
jgi:hypothetical protein